MTENLHSINMAETLHSITMAETLHSITMAETLHSINMAETLHSITMHGTIDLWLFGTFHELSYGVIMCNILYLCHELRNISRPNYYNLFLLTFHIELTAGL